MDADDYSVEETLTEGRRFMVPLYQRKYQWADNRLLPFWEDVEAKAAEVLEGSNKFKHYMGALLLSPLDSGSQIGVTPRVQVVDGQQRLTTFQLLIAAIREIAREYECVEIVEQANGYLFNQPKAKDADPLVRFKLTPTPSDRALFHDIIEHDYPKVRAKYAIHYWGSSVPKNTPYRALRAYDLFRKWVAAFAARGPSDVEPETQDAAAVPSEVALEIATVRLEALLRALLEQMKLVVITLGDGDDAQVIFETLNSKGEPLLAMDLVRNNIFHRAERQFAERGGGSADHLYNELWNPFDGGWWRVDAPNARPKRPRIDHFLAHMLSAETGQSIAMRELYAEYRSFAMPRGKPRFENVEDELGLLQKHSPTYEALEGRKSVNPVMVWLGRKFSAWQLTTAYPIAFQIAASKVSLDEQGAIARLVYSYIVRRAVCDLTGKSLNKLFQAIAQRFHEHGVSLDILRAFFASRSGESSRFPNDQEFRAALVEAPLYLLAPGDRHKDMLWELELASRSSLAEKIERPPSLWTEHVLPQSWNEKWPFEEGDFAARYSGDPKAMRRDVLVHALGNLTLMSGGLNISSGNLSFAEKQAKYEQHTGLFLNKWFSKKTAWSENDIIERGEGLAEKALSVWPGTE